LQMINSAMRAVTGRQRQYRYTISDSEAAQSCIIVAIEFYLLTLSGMIE